MHFDYQKVRLKDILTSRFEGFEGSKKKYLETSCSHMPTMIVLDRFGIALGGYVLL